MPSFVRRQVFRSVLLAPAVAYVIVGGLAAIMAVDGADELLQALKSLGSGNTTSTLVSEKVRALDAGKWSTQLEPSTLVLLNQIGITLGEQQLQRTKVGLINATEQFQMLAAQFCDYFKIQIEIQPTVVLFFLWLTAVLFVGIHVLELVVRALFGIVRATRRALWYCKRGDMSFETEIVTQTTAPAPASSEPVISAQESPLQQRGSQRPLPDHENQKPTNQSRRVDSPAKKRHTTKSIAAQDTIIVTRPEPVKKTKSDSKRMASPVSKVQRDEKPAAPEKWGDEMDECKSSVLLTMLNNATEEMLCGMIQSMSVKSAKKILEYRKKNGEFTCMSQVDQACHKGFAAKLLSTN